QGARLNDSKYFVIEGDEYDTAFFDKRSKFVHYLPELVIVNNIEFDHADIFKNIDEIKLSFKRLLNIVPQNGMVLLNGDDHNCVEVAKDCLAQMVEVGFSRTARSGSATSPIRPMARDSNLAMRFMKFRWPVSSTCATRPWQRRRRGFTMCPRQRSTTR